MIELQWGKPMEGWQLSVSTDRKQFLVGIPVHVSLVMKNVSSKLLPLPTPLFKWGIYRFIVRDEFGEIPLTRFGKRVEENRGEGSYAEPSIEPNGTVVMEVLISRLFDLSLRGSYVFEVSRMVFKQGSKEQVLIVSNKSTFEIIEE